MSNYLDTMNDFHDPRVCEQQGIPFYYDDEGEDEIVTLPWKWAVCDVCRGEGKHVNPSLDSGGLCDEFADDPEFMEDYMAGQYDVPCNCCGGKRVVPALDEDRCTPEQLKAYDDHLNEMAENARVDAQERAMGA